MSSALQVNGQLDCVVVSVHLKATGLEGQDLHRTKAEVASMSDVLDSVSAHVPGEGCTRARVCVCVCVCVCVSSCFVCFGFVFSTPRLRFII